MNKRQQIVLWIAVILISLTCIFYNKRISLVNYTFDNKYNEIKHKGIFVESVPYRLIQITLLTRIAPIILIGGLLIYTLRGRKK